MDGRVLAQRTGRPIGGAVVTLPDLGMRTASRRDGSFRFRRPVPAGVPYTPVRAVVRARGWGTWTVSGLPVVPGQVLELSAEMTRVSFRHRVLPSPENGPESAPPSLPTAPLALTGNTCTGWSSDLVPPPTIRVLQTQTTGKVGTFDFVFYMTHVLPREWIPSWDADALGAGAMAVKTYAWFRAMAGNAYSSGSNCADVTDYTSDQVFDPTYAYRATDQAVYATLGSILWKSGGTFLSQYWSGSQGDPCQYVTQAYPGRMDQWGTQTCAQTGMAWSSIVPVFYPTTTFTYLNNLLVNPTAEDPSMYMWNETKNATVRRLSGGAYGGAWYWSMKSTNGQNALFSQQELFDGTSSTQYHVKVALRCDVSKDCPVSLRVVTTASDGSWVSRTKSLTVRHGTGWHLDTYDPSSPGMAHVAVQVKVVSKVAVSIDNVTLTAPYPNG